MAKKYNKDPGAFYKVCWLNRDDRKKITSSTVRFYGEDLTEFMDIINEANDGLSEDEGLQVTFSLKTTNKGQSYAGRAFVKSYEYEEFDPEDDGGSDETPPRRSKWKARSNSQKERSRIKEHSIDDDDEEEYDEETEEETVPKRQSRSKRSSGRRSQ